MLWQVATLHSHPKHVRVHTGTGCLEPVAGHVTFIDDLIPKARLCILISLERLCQLLDYLDQIRSLRLIFRNDVEQYDERHRVPTKCTAPMKSGLVRGRVCPRLSATFIVRMPKQSSGRIIQML